jgi:hypothetical protein
MGHHGGMTPITVLSDDARTVDADLGESAVVIAETDLGAAIGWELTPEGLCQGDVCVPVRDRDSISAAGGLDLGAVAEALDRPFAVDSATAVAALGEPRQARRLTLGGQAAAFTLPDLDGNLHTLEEWRGCKKLLVAFASW